MTQRIVKDQAGLDKALAEAVDLIIVNSPRGVWLSIGGNGTSMVDVTGDSCIDRVYDHATVGYVSDHATVHSVSGNATVDYVSGNATVRSVYDHATVDSVYDRATVGRVSDHATVDSVSDRATVGYVYDHATVHSVYGNATVGYVSGSATVDSVYDRATVHSVYDRATVHSVYDRATVRYVYGSATVGYVYGSATVGYVSGSATVHLRKGGTVKQAASTVAVFLHHKAVTVNGGTVIDVSDIDLTTPEHWLANYGIEVTDGKAVLFKAVSADLEAGESYRRTTYPIGETVTAPDWKPTAACGQGLHVSPNPPMTRTYRNAPGTRWLAVEVDAAALVPLDDKAKVESLRVLYEVDELGDRIDATEQVS